jgi:glycosyltransferase involved in cell wall biosynthesis
MKKERLIFIYPKLFTFIQTEIELLSDNYELICSSRNWNNKTFLPLNLISQFFFLLFNINRVDIILISFGGYWSFLPVLLGKIFTKKVAIVVHGTDCVSFPDINYGNLRHPLMRWFTKKSYQWASIILPVSKSLVFTENNYYSDKTLKFGYSHHLEAITTPYKVIPNGLILENWRVDKLAKISNTFISVMTNEQILRKGGDLIIETAQKLPNCRFYLAGTSSVNYAPENVICLGKLSPDELKEWYGKSRFYLQLSNFEGFGVAICEAMLCECVPIVSDVNFLPTIVGDTGFILRKRNTLLLEDLIHNALTTDLEQLGKFAKNRIQQNFSISKRKEMLISALKD